MCGGGGGSSSKGLTGAQKAQKEIDIKLWNYYQESYRPLLDEWAGMVMSPEVQEQEKRQVAGQINAEIMKNLDPTKASTNPVKNTKVMSDVARMEAGAQVKGQGNVKAKQMGNVQNLINIGRGEATEAAEGMGNVAAQSVQQQLQDEVMKQQEQAITENMYGSLFGTAAGIGMSALNAPKPKTMKPISEYEQNYGYTP
jgi:hypothetical protein